MPQAATSNSHTASRGLSLLTLQDTSLYWSHNPFLSSFPPPITPAWLYIVPWEQRPVLLVSVAPQWLRSSRCSTKEKRLMACSYYPHWSSHSANSSGDLVPPRYYRDRKTHFNILDQWADWQVNCVFQPDPSYGSKDPFQGPCLLSSFSQESHEAKSLSLWAP